jgi:hypothetical protein
VKINEIDQELYRYACVLFETRLQLMFEDLLEVDRRHEPRTPASA